MKKHVLILLSFFCLYNCKKQQQDSLRNQNDGYIKFDINNRKKDLEEAIIKNDTTAYKMYFKEYVVNGYAREFLYYAILMAERNNYKGAYQDTSAILYSTTDDTLSYRSTFANFTLLKAYEMGDKVATQHVKYMYIEKGKKPPKSTSIYCENR